MTTTSDTPAPSTPPAPDAQETGQQRTFSYDYVKELRAENAHYRTKAKEQEELAAMATKAANEAIASAKADADARIIRAELKAAAMKSGMLDADGLKLADLTKVSLKDDGTIDGVEEMLSDLKKSKPYLFGQSTSHHGSPPPAAPPAAKRATEMTAEEYAAAKKAILGN